MRSEEQKAADAALTEAIERVHKAYRPDDAGLIGDYVVAYASNYIDPGDDEIDARVFVAMRNGFIPPYRFTGLLNEAVDPYVRADDDDEV